MEIEYSTEVKGKAIAFSFDKDERELLISLLKPVIKIIDKKIEKVWNNPKNEGQATFSTIIDGLKNEIKHIEHMIQLFSK